MHTCRGLRRALVAAGRAGRDPRTLARLSGVRRRTIEHVLARAAWISDPNFERLAKVVYIDETCWLPGITAGRVPGDVVRPLALEAIKTHGSLAAAAREAGLSERRLSGIVRHEFPNVVSDTYERVCFAARGPGGWRDDPLLRRWLWTSDASDVA